MLTFGKSTVNAHIYIIYNIYSIHISRTYMPADLRRFAFGSHFAGPWDRSYEAGLVHCGTMNPQLHSYDRHRTICTAEDKATASRLGGHSWNIISNTEQARKVTLKVLWADRNDWSSKLDPSK